VQIAMRLLIIVFLSSSTSLAQAFIASPSPIRRRASPFVAVGPLHNTITELEGSFSAALLKDHWGHEPILIRGAFSPENNNDTWPSWEMMMELACEEEGARIIRHTPGDLTSYRLDVGPFDDDDLSRSMQEKETNNNNKWTLVVNDVDRFHPSLSDWVDSTFAFIPRWRRDDAQISLAKQGGGIGPHVDNYDVFLIQTSGNREWQVGLNKVSAWDELDSAVPEIPVRILQDWDQRESVSLVLEPGDVLYIPPRVPHCGTAMTDHCMTLSVGCRAPSATELVSRLAEGLSESVASHAVQRYQDADLLLQTKSSHELTDTIKNEMKKLVVNAMHEILEDDDQWDALVGRIVTEPKRPQEDYPLPLVETEWRDELGIWGVPDKAVEAVRNGEGALYRAEGVSSAYSRVHDNTYRLFMNGAKFELTVAEEETEAVQSLLSAIVYAPALTAEILYPLSHQPVVLDLLENLLEEGLLYGSSDDE
jgi:50S ribosomal protein L16 3-hydroxylase